MIIDEMPMLKFLLQIVLTEHAVNLATAIPQFQREKFCLTATEGARSQIITHAVASVVKILLYEDIHVFHRTNAHMKDIEHKFL